MPATKAKPRTTTKAAAPKPEQQRIGEHCPFCLCYFARVEALDAHLRETTGGLYTYQMFMEDYE